MSSRLGRAAGVLFATMSVAALAACGDSRIKKLSLGISRDSALKVINEGAGGDSLARVYKQETYLMDGKITNILFYNKDGVKLADDSTLAPAAQTPIVSVAGKVTGWGWDHYDSTAKALNFKPSPHP